MRRIWLIAALMAVSVAGAAWLTPIRLAAGRQNIVLEDMVPAAVGDWRLDKTVRPILPRREDDDHSYAARIYDQTLARTYRNADNDRIMLVVAYGRNQSDALQLHLPEVCYASQGFDVARAGRATIALGDGATLPVNRLATRRGHRFEPVIYWTRVGDSVALSRLYRQWAKLRYGIRGLLPDGVLIRVSMISNQNERAFALEERFVRQLLQSVDPVNRPFFLGENAFDTI